MTELLPKDHPNLAQAVQRLRRSQWIWGLSLVAGWPALDLPASEASLAGGKLAVVAPTLSVGLGAGSAFSHTDRRMAAIAETTLGVAGFLPGLDGDMGL